MMLVKVFVISFHLVLAIAMGFISIEQRPIVNLIFSAWIIVLPIRVVVQMDNVSIEIQVAVRPLIKFIVTVSIIDSIEMFSFDFL